MPSASSKYPKAWPFVVLALLTAWIFFLRFPSFPQTMWNVDETIHATIARTLLDGGVLYKDAIDQRTPLSYYAFAAVFKVFGDNNLYAVRAVLAALIALTAFGLFLIGSRLLNRTGGLVAAVTFCALSFCLFAPADAFAAHTEWFAIFFTTLGTFLFWKASDRPAPGRFAWAGAAFACAALSKQPALLDFAAPLLTLAHSAVIGRRFTREVFRSILGLSAGFILVIGVVIALFMIAGAGRDFYFYAWYYNLHYYGPEISSLDRILTIVHFAFNGFNFYPFIFALAAIALIALGSRLGQWTVAEAEKQKLPAFCYLAVWSLASLAGAASGGRDFQHYYIQVLPPLALLAAWLPSLAVTAWPRAGIWVRTLSVLLFASVIWSTVVVPLQFRRPVVMHDDGALRAAAFVRANSADHESIFVWGFQPDFYYYSQRKSASRFVYGTFLTGLIPWTNVARDKNTDYAIVPGAMDTLLKELNDRRPAFIADFSVGPHNRYFDKYPLSNFPRLDAFIRRHYVEVQPSIYPLQGVRIFQLFDTDRKEAFPLTGAPTSNLLSAPSMDGPGRVRPAPTDFTLFGGGASDSLQRLELLVNGKSITAVTFAPTSVMAVKVRVPFDQIGPGEHTLVVRATSTDGKTADSAPFTVACEDQVAAPETLRAFAVPVVADALTPQDIFAPFGLSFGVEEGQRIYFAHAPSQLIYRLTPGLTRLKGEFGFRPGAYAANNPSPTDGAEFIVELVRSGGTKEILFQQWVRPTQFPAERALQTLDVAIPSDAVGELQLRISPGPHGSNACDWTYWSNLSLEKSR